VLLASAIQTHPSAIVRDTLDLLIREEVVLLNFDEEIAGNNGGDATVFLLNVEGLGIRPVLAVHPALLGSDATDADRWRALLHVTVHLLQLLRSESPPEYFVLHTAGRAPSVEELVTVFEDDVIASCIECQFALEHHLPCDDALCGAFALGGERALRQALADVYRADPDYVPFSALLDTLAESSPRSFSF
jgi:hypothetical protein